VSNLSALRLHRRPCEGNAEVGDVTTFINRREQLAWWRERLDEVLDGQPRVVLIPGEAGIGKTSFVRHVQAVERAAVRFHYSRCLEEISLPYSPFVDGVLSQLGETLGELDRALGEHAAPIRQLLRQREADGGAAAGPPTDRDRYRLFAAVAHAVIATAQAAPTVLVLDDLHWADRPSLDLLRHVVFAAAEVGERERLPLMIVGLHRPVGEDTALAGLLSSLQRERICQTLLLPQFDEADTADLIQSLHHGRPSAELVATVAEATRGNPLFAQEAVRQLLREGALEARGGELVTTATLHDLRFPEHVSGAIAARLQGLSEPCRAALAAAALLGDPISPDLVARLTGLGHEPIESALHEAQLHGLLRRQDGQLEFAHPLVQHVVSHAPPPAERADSHRRVAELLEQQSAADGRDRVFQVAHHLISAGPAADAALVVAGVRRAADQAFGLYAWGEAARYYEVAVSAARRAEAISQAELAELHYRTAYSSHRDRNPSRCLEHYDHAVAAYRAAGDDRGVAQALADRTRAQFELVPVPYGTLIDVQPLEHAVRALGEAEPRLRGRIWETIGEVYWTARQPERAREMSERAVRLGVDTDDPQLCAYSRLGMALAEMQQLDLAAALRHYDTAYGDAVRARDLWLEAQARQRRPLVLTWMGRLDEAEAAALESHAFSRRLHDWSGCSLSSTTSAAVALARGAFADVELHAREGMRMMRRSSYPWGALLFLPALAAARALRGDFGAAEDAVALLEEPGRVFPEPGSSVRFVAWVYRQLIAHHAGHLERDAALQLVQAIQGVLRNAASDVNTIVCACALVEIGAAAGAAEAIAPAAASLAEAVRRDALLCNSWSFLVPRVCGVAAAVGRRWDEAEEHLDHAVHVARSAGARPELARTYLDQAVMLAARAGADGRASAIDRLHQANAVLAELGMRPLQAQAEALADRLRTSLAPPPPPASGLDERETEVLVQIAVGRSDAEIAEDLLLGATTIAAVVASVLRKTGSADRAAAISWATHRGLGARSPQALQPPSRAQSALPTEQTAIIMFTDMQDSTALIDRVGDLRAHEVLRIHNGIVRDCLARHGGREIKHTGDGVNAWFGSAAAALACAVAINRGLAAYNHAHPHAAIRVRIGLNAGTPIAEEGQLYGAAVNAAARICAHAGADQILVSDVVRQLAAGKGFSFADQGHVNLKGFSQPFHLHSVAWE